MAVLLRLCRNKWQCLQLATVLSCLVAVPFLFSTSSSREHLPFTTRLPTHTNSHYQDHQIKISHNQTNHNMIILPSEGQLIGPPCKRHEEEVVPRVVYYVIFRSMDTIHGRLLKFEFTHAMSILSAHKFVKPKHIYIVGNWEPTGEYWEWVKEQVPELEHMHHDLPKFVHGRPLDKRNLGFHASDTIRLKTLLDYGGIYMDTDAIVANPLDELLHYDFSIGQMSGGAEFGNGILLARPGATFLKIWLDAYNSYNGEWNIFSTVFPMKMSKYFGHLMHIERTSFYRPDSFEKQLLFQKHYNWSQNYFIHVWWGARPQSQEETKGWNSTIGEIYRNILFDSPELKEKPIPWYIICNKQKSNTGCRRTTPKERIMLMNGSVHEVDLPEKPVD